MDRVAAKSTRACLPGVLRHEQLIVEAASRNCHRQIRLRHLAYKHVHPFVANKMHWWWNINMANSNQPVWKKVSELSSGFGSGPCPVGCRQKVDADNVLGWDPSAWHAIKFNCYGLCTNKNLLWLIDMFYLMSLWTILYVSFPHAMRNK